MSQTEQGKAFPGTVCLVWRCFPNGNLLKLGKKTSSFSTAGGPMGGTMGGAVGQWCAMCGAI